MKNVRFPWYMDAVFYQIYPQSFCDTNNDGTGDIKGITQKLDYVQELGINAIWLNPICESPFNDAGYDISDYYKIAPRYGNLVDLKILLKEAHNRNIKVILDMVFNHTSDQHKWFQKSKQFKRNSYSKWYIWNDRPLEGKWIMNVSGRHETYFSTFHPTQVDLNYGILPLSHQNENHKNDKDIKKLWNEMFKVVRYWLDLGVDGFRCDVAAGIGDKPFAKDETIIQDFWGTVRKISDSYGEKVLVAEEWLRYIDAINKWGFHLAFTKNFLKIAAKKEIYFNETNQYLKSDFSGDPCMFDESLSRDVIQIQKKNSAIALTSSNHDLPRPSSGTDCNDDLTILANLIVFTNNCVPFIYYGDEIGMKYDLSVPSVEGSGQRAACRTPMQWNSDINAGFSKCDKNKLYLPVSDDYKYRNVGIQYSQKGSIFDETKKIINCRKMYKSLSNYGEKITLFAKKTNPVYVYARKYNDELTVVAMNASPKPQKVFVDFRKIFFDNQKSILLKEIISKHHTNYNEKKQSSALLSKIPLSFSSYDYYILRVI